MSGKEREFLIHNKDWIVNFAFFLFTFLIFQNSDPVANYFDSSPYFAFLIFIPALLLLLATMILQIKVDLRYLSKIYSVAEIIFIFIFGFISLQFETYNGDVVMYIGSYLIIYHRYLFGSIVALSIALIYLSTLQKNKRIRENRELKNELFMINFNNFAFGMILALGLLIVANYWSYGISLIISGTIYEFLVFYPIIKRDKTRNDNLQINNPEEGSNEKQANIGIQNSSRVKNLLVVLISFVAMVVSGYFWPLNYIFYFNGDFTYFSQNSHFLIMKSMTALLIFSIFAIILILSGAIQKISLYFSKNNNTEMIECLILFGLIGLMYALMNVGTFFGVSFSLLMVPWIVFILIQWVNQIFFDRKVESPGLLWAIFFFTSFASWGGFLLGLEADDSFTPEIWNIVILTLFLLILFLYVMVNPRIKPRDTESSEQKISQTEIQAEQNIRKRHEKSAIFQRKPIQVCFLLLMLMCPILLIYVPATASSNFQILSNIDNYCLFYLADPTTRISQNYKPNFGLSQYKNTNNTIQLNMAKNEYESIQIVMLPINQQHMSIYGISFSGFANETHPNQISIVANQDTFKSYIVGYVEPLGNVVPDILYDFNSIAVSSGKNLPLWFTFYVPKETKEGKYNGTLRFEVTSRRTTDGGVYSSQFIDFNILLNIFNFTLPEIPTLKSCFGFSKAYPDYDIVMQWYQEHRMMHWSSFSLPMCSLNPDGTVNELFTAKMDQEIGYIYGNKTYRMAFHWSNSSILPDGEFEIDGVIYNKYNYTIYAPQNTIKTTYSDYFNKLITYLDDDSRTYLDDFGNNRSWYDDTYLNGQDEIEARPREQLYQVLSEYDWLKNEVGCDFPLMQTVMEPDADIIDDLLMNVDIICWHTSGYEFDFITQGKQQGKEIWIYTTRGPRFPVPSISTSGMAIQVRALGWQCFVFNYSTYLIWDVACPVNGNDGYGYQGWNGGSLLYRVPGGFALSTRMEMIREGFEDHDYFFLLKKSIEHLKNTDPTNVYISVGESLLNKITSLFGPGYDTEMDYRVVNQLRLEIGLILDQISIF